MTPHREARIADLHAQWHTGQISNCLYPDCQRLIQWRRARNAQMQRRSRT